LLGAPYPDYINLNTISGESSWHTSRETGMPEDERLDHLLLKFARESEDANNFM